MQPFPNRVCTPQTIGQGAVTSAEVSYLNAGLWAQYGNSPGSLTSQQDLATGGPDCTEEREPGEHGDTAQPGNSREPSASCHQPAALPRPIITLRTGAPWLLSLLWDAATTSTVWAELFSAFLHSAGSLGAYGMLNGNQRHM